MAYTQSHTTQPERAATQATPRTRRWLSALSLFVLAPLVGEFLLGNLPITWLWALLALAPLYGGGALLIRELARRFRLGWPGMIVLGLVYAIIEEAFITQSLFNPNYVGLRLLDYGYISPLGISAWWTVFVLGIHTIWSTSVPIALVEILTPSARRTPWLGPWGLALTVFIFLVGCALTFTSQLQGEVFFASTMQFATSAVVCVLLIIVALMVGRAQRNTPTNPLAPPSVTVAGVVAFIIGSAFMIMARIHEPLPAVVNVAVALALLALGIYLLWQWSHRSGWSLRHQFAVAGGLLLVYAWFSFVQTPSVEGTSPLIDALGNVVFGIGALILLTITWHRLPQLEMAGDEEAA